MIWGNPVWQGWKRSKALRDARETRREIIYMREATRKGRTRDLVRQSETLYKRPQLLIGVNMRHTEWHYFLCSCSWEFNKTWTVRFSSSRWSWKFITRERHNLKLTASARDVINSAVGWKAKKTVFLYHRLILINVKIHLALASRHKLFAWKHKFNKFLTTTEHKF